MIVRVSGKRYSLSQALIHGLGRHYYSLPINYRKNELEQKVRLSLWLIQLLFSKTVCMRLFLSMSVKMLLNLHKKTWMDGLKLTDYKEHSATNEKTIKVGVSSC